MKNVQITLKPGRDRSVLKGNPWIFSGAVDKTEGFEFKGQTCDIYAADKTFLGTGYINPDSQIACRLLSHERIEISPEFLSARIKSVWELRKTLYPVITDAVRAVNSEGDFLPGLIIDRYGEGVVVQILTAGMEIHREAIFDIIKEFFTPSFIFERSDTGARAEEKLPQKTGIVYGGMDKLTEITEHGLRFKVDISGGQKTGFFLDQRDSRFLVRNFTNGGKVLNLFSYTGGFSVSAAKAGAEYVVSVDSSAPALELAKENMEINGFGSTSAEYLKEDVFNFLNRDNGKWDVIILDPPAFAQKKTAIEKAARGYKDINMRAMKKIVPGGVLATFSCSHHISPALFRQIAYSAAVDAGRDVQVIAQTSHPSDHPFNLCHIEGEYLKGLFLRVF